MTLCRGVVKKYDVMYRFCDNLSQQVYMWWKKMTLCRDVVKKDDVM